MADSTEHREEQEEAAAAGEDEHTGAQVAPIIKLEEVAVTIDEEDEDVLLVMRQTKTLKICANHLVVATTKMQEHAGSDKLCVWHALDFTDGELKRRCSPSASDPSSVALKSSQGEEVFNMKFGEGEAITRMQQFQMATCLPDDRSGTMTCTASGCFG